MGLRKSLLSFLPILMLVTACGSSSPDTIDEIFGSEVNDAPLLTPVQAQVLAQTDILNLNIDNIKKGTPGTDVGMSYKCYYDDVVDNAVDNNLSCTSLPGSQVTFNETSGELLWTPQTALGNFELKVVGTFKGLEASVLFPVSVRLKFNGITSLTSITGTGVTVNWTPNTQAQSYQIYKLNFTTGLYEIFQFVAGGSSSGANVTGLTPNTGYSLRVQALDIYGNTDGNTVSKSFTTNLLTRFSMTPLASTVSAGTALPIVVRAFNADSSPQTIGGLTLTPQIQSGNSGGIFSVVTDHDDGTYSFTFTPTTVGTPLAIEVTSNISFFLNNTAGVSVIPGAPSAANSSLTLSSNTVVSGNSVSITGQIRDAYNNPLPTSTVVFSATGGTSTGTLAATTNAGAGIYTSTFSGIVAGTSKTLRVTVDGALLANTTTIAVLAGPAISLNSTLVIGASTITSGSSTSLTATLRDLNNNTINSGVLVSFNKSGGTSSGSIGGIVNAGSGQYTSSYTGNKSGTAQTITVSVDGVVLTPTVNVSVIPGAVDTANSSLTISNPSVISGSFVTATVTLKDTNNNLIDSGIVVSFTKTGGTSTGTFGAVSNQGNGVYNIRYTGVVAGSAQTLTALIDGVAVALTTSVTVTPGAPATATSTIAVSSGTVISGANVTVTVALKDANSNPINSGILVAISPIGGTSTGTLSAITNVGNGSYTATYTGVLSGTAQTLNILTDGITLGPSTTIQVLPASTFVANSSLIISSATVTSGAAVTLTATLRDLNNNPIDSGSTIAFTKTGGTSTGTFSAVVPQGNGVYTTTYTGVVSGTAQSLNVSVNTLTPLAAVTITVTPGVASPVTSSIAISAASVAAGSLTTVTATIKDANSNPISSGILVTFSKSGGTSSGTFSAVTNLGSGQYAINFLGETAGSAQTINVLVDSVTLGPNVNVTVVPGAPNVLLSTLAVSSSTVVAGSSVLVTATIRDSYSNPINSGLIVAFDKSGGTSSGAFSAAVNQGNGSYTTNYTGATAGTAQTIQANVNTWGFGATQTVQVLVGAPNSANSTLTITTSPVQSGATASVAALIRDAYNNPITSEYAITFDAITGTSTGTFAAVNNAGSGNFSTTYQGVNAGTAQTVRVFADGIQISGLTSVIQVVPGAVNAANSFFTTSSATVQAGSSVNLSMNLRDLNNNAISSGLTLTFNKSAGVSNGTIGAVVNNASGNYSTTYLGVTQGAAQTVTLVVNGTPVAALNVSISVTSGAPTQLTIVGPVNPVESINCNGPYDVILKDASNNTTYSTSAFTMAMSSAPAGWSGTIFSDSSCNTSITSLSFGISITNQQFYYKSYTPQSISFTLTPSIGTIAPQSKTITNGGALSWIGTASQFTFNGSGSSTIQDDTTGFVNPADVIIDDNYMYVADYTGNRILKLNVTTQEIEGWIGTVGGLENISSYDNSGTCSALSVGVLTPIWCKGGRSLQTGSTYLISPRSIAVDNTYLYVTLPSHRILRFDKVTGAAEGWFGRINSIAGMTPAGCVTAGPGATTPTWCYGGSAQLGTGDGQFNNPQQIVYYNNYLYVSDYSNHRIQRIDVNGTAAGWVGQVGATAPAAPGQLGTCAPLPTTGNPTPGWCLGGVSQISNRYNLAATPVEIIAPAEGFNAPIGITADSTYLYVGDSNARIVRVPLVSGAINGFLGNSPLRATPSNNATPATNASRYTSNWSTGGVIAPSSSTTGFHPNIRGLNTDGTYIYFVDDYHRLGRVNSSDGQGFVQLGRAGSTPTGGVTGCSSTPVGGIAPGWCTTFSTNSINNINGAFYNPYSVTFNPLSLTELYVADYNNFRIQRFNISSGVFNGWIGSSPETIPTWKTSIGLGNSASRAGTNDYSTGEVGTVSIALGGVGNNLFATDYSFHRIKKFNKINGTLNGYVGLIGTYAPTGPIDCVGYTSGLTPTWCLGGGRTIAGAGIQAYSNPLGITADATYVYIANTGNHRIDRVRISDGLYMGWIGRVLTTPTDGESTCTITAPGADTPGWCIGGTAASTTALNSFASVRSINYNADGFLYVMDSHYQITKINTTTGAIIEVTGNGNTPAGCTVSGNVATSWCTSTVGVGAVNGYGGINASNSMTTNSNYIYVIDSVLNRISRFDKSTGAPAGFIGRLTGIANLNTGIAGNACFGLVAGYPQSTPGWCFGTTIGTNLNHSAGSIDNAFSGAMGIWADNSFIYVSDTNNNRVVKIDATTGAPLGWRGMIASTAGMTDPSCIAAGVGAITPKWCLGGSSTNSRVLGGFDYPTGMWGDSHYVYVYDTRNNRTVTLPK